MAQKINFIVSGVLVAAFSAASASAHISLERASTHKSRYGDTELKEGPCGRANGTRGTNVYTYAPGQTITVEFAEFIPHPSYFRFAFDADGDNDFKEPASIKPIEATRACPLNAADKCGTSDFYNSASVLPNMDNLNPHSAAQAKTKYTFQVKLPDVECTNCTLQILQVMEDTVHGAYNPTPGDPADFPYIADIYHQCIDLVLTRGSTGTGGTGPGGAGGSSGTGAGATGGTGGAGAAGGTDGVGGTGAGAGGSTGAGAAGGVGAAGGAGGAGAAAGAGGRGGTSATGGSGGAQGTPPAPSAADDSGCTCSVYGRSAGAASWLLALGLGAGLMRRRARR